jgi:hypothetical protein
MAVIALLCEDIKDMAAQTLLTTEHITAMLDAEFEKCIATFGSGDHTMETRKAILDRVRTAIGGGQVGGSSSLPARLSVYCLIFISPLLFLLPYSLLSEIFSLLMSLFLASSEGLPSVKT